MRKTAPIGVFADVSLGKMLQPAKKVDGDILMPYLRAAHIQANGRLDPSVEQKEMWVGSTEREALDIRAGDVLVVEGGAVGRSTVLKEDLPGVAYQNALIRLRPFKGSDGRFIDYCLQSAVVAGEIDALCTSVSIAHFTAEKVGRFRIPHHGLTAQQRIADFLDRETGEIDAMIAKMDQTAEVLENRKVSVIQQATQLNRTGERWDTVPTAHLFGSIGSGTTPKGDEHYSSSGDGIPWITTSELRETEIFGTAKSVTPAAVSTISSLKVHPSGSIAIAMYGATIGRLGTLGVDAATNQACCVFSEPAGVDMRFFYYTLWGQRDDIIRLAVGGGQPNISQTMLRRWRVPCPPFDEQKRIADHLDEVTGKIDAMLAKVAELKSLLTERRAALITDVVTGRKEVA